jgi:hypothetical protein
MDIIVICNGLGNQMSQYAFYQKKKCISDSTYFIFDKKSRLDHNGFELAKVFKIPYVENFKSNLLCMLFRILGIKKLPFFTKPIIFVLGMLGIRLINENGNYDFDPKHLLPSKGITFYYGGWHSEKYFKDIKDSVSNSFVFEILEDDLITLELADQIRAVNSVSVHIRRGDYLSQTNYLTFGAVCTTAYFVKAIEKIQSLTENPFFYVFSNDTAWVEENLKVENMVIVDTNKGENSWKDMYLMSLCKHNINSNSSFSWWASWLNDNKNKHVIVPKYFINNVDTKDVFPESWTSITEY